MLAISFVLLYFAFKGVKWHDFVEGIKDTDLFWICISMITSIICFILRGLRWRLLMLPVNRTITRTEAYDGVTIGYLTNFALPRAGEFARCGVISSTGKASFESVLGTVVLERSADLICYIVILTVVIFGLWDRFGAFIAEEILSPATGGLSMSMGIILGIVAITGISCCFAIYIFRERLSRYRLFRKLFSMMKGLVEGLKAGVRMKNYPLFLIYTLLIWVCYWLMSLTTIYAIPEASALGGMDALFLMIIGGLGWLVPVQGGIGAFHFILSFALTSIYGIPQTEGVIFATISHESQAFTMILCGLLSWLHISVKARKRFASRL